MITARVEFTEASADYFCPEPGQRIVEVKFESVDALIETLRELESSVVNCTVTLRGKVFDLRNLSGHPRPAVDAPAEGCYPDW